MGRQNRCNRPTIYTPPDGFGAFDIKAPMHWIVPQPPPTSYNLLPTGVHRPCSSPDAQPYKSASLTPVDGKRPTAKNLLAGGLEGLMGTASAAMACFPYISSISNLLCLTANIRDEMKRYTTDGSLVMHKLDEITSLLSSLGQWCAAHKLEERDLPPSLREIFQRMRTKLDEVRHELIKSTGVRSTMKRIISRKDMIRSIKQCDAKLSHLVQTLQVALAIDARLEQIKIIRNSCGHCTYDDRLARRLCCDSR